MNQNKSQTGPMAGQPGPADISALNSLRGKLLPLVNLLEGMKAEMMNPAKPPDWPTIQRSTANINTLMESIQKLLNDPSTTHTFASLHPYPISPYPINDVALGNLATAHLRKTLEIHDQDWVTDCIAKASEFAYVPEDWGVELRHPEAAEVEAGKDDEDDAGGNAASRVKRTKGSLDEDQLMELWTQSAELVYAEIDHVQTGSKDDEEDEEEEDDDDEDEDEDEEMGGVDQRTDAEAGKAKIVVVQPLMPIEVLHKFTMTGAAVVEPQMPNFG